MKQIKDDIKQTDRWIYVISSDKKNIHIDWKELWNYHDLYYRYVKRNIATTYKQTVFSYAWFFIMPIFTTIMYMIVFGGIAGISTNGIPQPVFYMSGILLWNYFANCFNFCSTVLLSNVNIFSKVYFPRLIVPFAGVTSELVKLGVQLLLLITVYLYYMLLNDSFCPNLTLFLFPIYVIVIGGTAMALGLIVSSMTVKYRDLTLIVSFILSLYMYATPVIYPMSITANSKYGWIIEYNPLSPIFESFRYSLTGIGNFQLGGLLYSLLFMIGCMIVAIYTFSRAERNFVDTI